MRGLEICMLSRKNKVDNLLKRASSFKEEKALFHRCFQDAWTVIDGKRGAGDLLKKRNGTNIS
jgi:hypothetical protein